MYNDKAKGWKILSYVGRTKVSSVPQTVDICSGTNLMSYLEGKNKTFPGIYQPTCEDLHCPPYIAKVKNTWSCTSIQPVSLYGLYDNYTSIS